MMHYLHHGCCDASDFVFDALYEWLILTKLCFLNVYFISNN